MSRKSSRNIMPSPSEPAPSSSLLKRIRQWWASRQLNRPKNIRGIGARLYSIAEHPFLLGGALTMLVTAWGFEINDKVVLSSICFVVAWIFTILAVHRSRAFEGFSKRNRRLGQLIASVVAGAFFVGCWWIAVPGGPKWEGYISEGMASKISPTDTMLSLKVTLSNKGDPATIKRWEILAYTPSKGQLPLTIATHPMNDCVSPYDNVTVIAPCHSQDLSDRVDAVTKERPAVGVVSFGFKGITESELMADGSYVTLIFWDSNDHRTVFPEYEAFEKKTTPEHMPGLNERAFPRPSPSASK